MSMQKKCALAEATAEDAKNNNVQLHNTTKPRPCQLFYGVCAWLGFIGLLGIVGGMENNAVAFVPGIICAALCMVLWAVSLRKGGWLK